MIIDKKAAIDDFVSVTDLKNTQTVGMVLLRSDLSLKLGSRSARRCVLNS